MYKPSISALKKMGFKLQTYAKAAGWDYEKGRGKLCDEWRIPSSIGLAYAPEIGHWYRTTYMKSARIKIKSKKDVLTLIRLFSKP